MTTAQLVSVEEYLHTSCEYDAEYVERKVVPAALRTKVDEFFTFGVPYVWVIDPASRTGEIYTPDRIAKITDGQLTAGQICIDLNQFD